MNHVRLFLPCASLPKQLPQSHSRPATDQRPALRGEQSGDFEGLEIHERKGFESVTELAEEGQDLEAERLDAVEKAPDPDQTELKTRDLPNQSRPRKFEDRNRL